LQGQFQPPAIGEADAAQILHQPRERLDLFKQPPIRTALAAGMPAELLTRRSDILQAEHELRAANADIGAARAAFFPRISLTAAFGFASLALDGLFKGHNRTWPFSPAIAAPIFRGGELRDNLDLARLRKSIAVARYEKTIRVAFREVADGLAARASYVTQLTEQQEVVRQAERRTMLSGMVYQAGMSSQLELLDAQRTSYTARQGLLTVRREELASATSPYRALGGVVENKSAVER
jgi:multidrug efflux system outer membrane protein